jgi:adenylate cyclase
MARWTRCRQGDLNLVVENLTLGPRVMAGIDLHSRSPRSAGTFEAAIVLSPSSAFAYMLGSIQLGFAGEVERAIEWGERGLRLSPLDPWSFVACHGMFLAHFQVGRFEQATNAARKSVQHNPGFSISHMFLAAALGTLGRIDEAKAAASRVLALQPGFSIAEWCAATDPVPAIAEPLSDALRAARWKSCRGHGRSDDR